MKLRLIAVAGALTAAVAAPSAFAEPVTAKLQAPTDHPVKLVAGGAIFECLGDVCAARTPSSDTAGVRGCKDLARQVGPVGAFGLGSRQLSPDQLVECNASARK
ncbi:MAG TPA: hypothetical protein VJP88_10395 [Caulobacteraceae bacterium]|nr:hypothetical protein [Caulobacteraceae bacterium]